MSKEELKDKIKLILNENIKEPHFKAFFFGSRASGKAMQRSDIDIGILAAKPIPLNVMGEIKTELDKLRVLQKFDVVDFNDADDDFKKVALKSIEVIYER